MNPAAAIALVAATLNIGAAVVLAVISKAPGWRAARVSAALAATAGLYSCTSFVFCVSGLDTSIYYHTARITYLAAHLNTLLWFLLAFGGTEPSWAAAPRAVRWYSGASLGLGLALAASGVHLQPRVEVVDVSWAGVAYHYPVTTGLGDWYGILILLQFSVTFVQFLRRLLQGERSQLLQVLAFGVLFGTSIVEVLVANRVVEFLSPADVGMLVVVLPLSIRVVRRFVSDADRLNEWSGRLAGTLRTQSQWRDRAQVALAEAERMAALGRMAAGVGHEINNPLTYLTLSLDEVESHLRATGAPKDVIAALSHARDGATRIQRVAERLRTYSRRHQERVPTDLRDVVKAAVNVAAPALDPSIDVTFRFDPVPRILGDEPTLVQALVSVLTNASQAVKEKSVTGSIRVSTTTSETGEAILAVEDNGVGISAEHLGRLGEPYFTTRAEAGGLGLGLFVTRGIVDAHGGRVHIDSTPDVGTAVRLAFAGLRETLQAVTAVAARDAGADPAAQTGPPPKAADVLPFPQPVPPGEKPSVLVIDDEPLVARLLATILRRTWDVTVASSGAEALEFVAGTRFDAILCDLMMPGMSGIEVAEALNQRDPDHRRRMLFLTGGAVTIEAEEFLARADVRHMTKPVSRAELHAALDEFRVRRS
ncbi:MAG: response regulator [Vicinamibacterales bacterium]|nr:response regulator [Vicinamibacterales bacterium]